MTKFLHISDIHLGIKRYGIEARTRDFFHAWRTCLEKYAIDEQVDFVLIGGDLFDRRQIDPQAANHAIFGFEMLKAAGIPVFAIEGNHDQRENSSNFSWLSSLSQWRFLHLLEPSHDNGSISYLPWHDLGRKGGYIDCKDVRIFGSRWYGVTTGNLLPQLKEAIRPHLRENAYNIMMLHTEVEGQLNRPIPGLSSSKLLQLREGIDYLALGHIHKNFVIDNWAYNPGSLEAATIDEYQERRGAYLVELKDGEIKAELMQGYQQRSFLFWDVDLSKFTESEAASNYLGDFLRQKCPLPVPEQTDQPIIELTLKGRLSFKSSLLKLEIIKNEVIDQKRVLEVIFRNETVPLEYAVAADITAGTSKIEREIRILQDLVAHTPHYRDRAVDVANMILEIKRLTLMGEPPEQLLEALEYQYNHMAQAQLPLLDPKIEC